MNAAKADRPVSRAGSLIKKGLLALSVLLLVAIVAGYFVVPSVVAGQAARIINANDPGTIGIAGRLSVRSDDIGVSWGGPITVRGLSLADGAGKPVAKLDLTTSKGLLAWATDRTDLGRLTIGGTIDLVRTTGADGTVTTNLQSALARHPSLPAPAPAAVAPGAQKPAALPPGLAADVRIETLGITLTDVNAQGQTTGGATLNALSGDVQISNPATGNATARVQLGGQFGSIGQGAATGKLQIDAQATGLTNARSELTPTSAKVTAKVDIADAPTGLFDALAGQGGVLTDALGPRVNLSINVSGNAGASGADIKLSAPSASADIGLASDGARIKATRPGQISLRSLAFAQRLPAVAKALADAGLTVDASGWPGATVSLARLDMPTGAKADYRGASVELSVLIEPLVGTLQTPGSVQAQPVRVEATRLSVRAPDLATGATIEMDTRATISGQSAGDVRAMIKADGLLDPRGELMPASGRLPRSIAADIRAASVATSLLQPVLSALAPDVPLRLSEDVGPTIDLSLQAQTGDAPVNDGNAGLPPTRCTLSLRSSNLQIEGDLDVSAALIEARKERPLALRINRAGPALARALHDAGVSISGDAPIAVTLVECSVPLVAGKPQLEVARLLVRATVGQAGARVQGLSIDTGELNAELDVEPRKDAIVRLGGPLTIDGRPVRVLAELAVAGLISPSGQPNLVLLGSRRAAGSVRIEGVPGSALQKLAGLSGDAGDPLAQLVGELAGQDVNVVLACAAGDSSVMQPVSVQVTGTTGLRADVRALIGERGIELRKAEAGVTVTPQAAQAALRLAGQSAGAVAQVSLRAPAEVGVVIQPIDLPWQGAGKSGIDWSRVGDARLAVSASISQPIIADGVQVGGPGSPSQSFGLANLRAQAALPLAMLEPDVLSGKRAAPIKGETLQAGLSADVIGRDASDLIARLSGEARAEAETGTVRASLTLSDVATARADALLGKPGYVSGAVGERAAASVSAVRLGTGQPFDITGDLSTGRLNARNVKIALSDDAVRIAQPLTVRWELDPVWANANLLGGAQQGALQLAETTVIEAEVRALSIARPRSDAQGAPLVGPLKRGVFSADALVRVPRAVVSRVPMQAGAAPAPLTVDSLRAEVKSTPTGGVSFDVAIITLRAGAAATTQPTRATGTIERLADARGVLTPADAVLTLSAQASDVPTSIVEAMTGEPGSLESLLGSTLTVQINLADVTRSPGAPPGRAAVSLTSPNAGFKIGGPIEGGVLDTTPATATRLSAELSEFRYKKAAQVGPTSALNPLGYLGVVAGVERLRDEVNKRPSLVTSPDLRLPIDGDLRKLNGRMDVDLGRMNLKLDQNILSLLDIAALNKAVDRISSAQQRPVPPFAININQGVATYQNVELPLGSYTFKAGGTVDLVNRQIDVVTFVPTVALAPGVLGSLNDKMGSALGRIIPLQEATMIPLRTRGPMDNPTTAPDFELFIKNFAQNATNPENILNAIGGLLGGDRNKDQPPAQGPQAPQQPGQQPGEQPKDQPKDQPKEQPRRFPLPFPLPR
jgi:hypothetical protein